MEIIGWIGSVLFAICGLPQAIQSYNEGHSDGLNWFFILPWLFGELFTLVYIFPKGDMPLIFNYVLNLIFLLVILYYKVKPRK